MNGSISHSYEPQWWSGPVIGSCSGISVVSVTYNTQELIARLLWSLYRFMRNDLRDVIIVDNGSSDGTHDLLKAMSAAGLCHVIHNDQNRYHGPALTQALSYLAEKYKDTQPRPWIWILDSDCMIAREDASTAMLNLASSRQVAVLGEPRWDQRHEEERIHGFSVLLDPSIVRHSDIGGFQDGGDPVGEFGNSCRECGISLHSFPFTEAGYIIHRGRATLAGILKRREMEHPLFNWAKDHYEPHFQGVYGACERYTALVIEVENAGGSSDANSLIKACGVRNFI